MSVRSVEGHLYRACQARGRQLPRAARRHHPSRSEARRHDVPAQQFRSLGLVGVLGPGQRSRTEAPVRDGGVGPGVEEATDQPEGHRSRRRGAGPWSHLRRPARSGRPGTTERPLPLRLRRFRAGQARSSRRGEAVLGSPIDLAPPHLVAGFHCLTEAQLPRARPGVGQAVREQQLQV